MGSGMANKPAVGAMVLGVLLPTRPAGEVLNRGDAVSALEFLASPAMVDFFVSPQGDDRPSGELADPGDNDGPFATVQRAQEAVRALVKTLPKPRSVRVVLRGGTYFLDQPLEFAPDDPGTEGAPVIYEAAPGEKVVISGGRRLEGGEWGEVNGHKAWMVDLPEVREGR